MASWTSAQSGNWSDPTRWTGAIPNGADAIATFNQLTAAAAVWTIDLQGGTDVVGTLNLSASTTQAYDILNGVLEMKTASLVRGATANINVNGPATGPVTTLASNLGLKLTSDTTVNVATAGSVLDIVGAITGSGDMIKTGAGTVRLGHHGNQDFWLGRLIIASGKLITTAAEATGAGAVDIAASATFDIGGFDQLIGALSGAGVVTNNGAAPAFVDSIHNTTVETFAGAIQDGTSAIELIKHGTGTLVLSGANSYSGFTQIQQGVIKMGASGAFSAASTLIIAGGFLDLAGTTQDVRDIRSLSVAAGKGGITNGSSTGAILNIIAQGSGGAPYDGHITDGLGAVSLNLKGTGALRLAGSGSSTYSGATHVFSGTLAGGAANAFSANSEIQLDPSAKLDLGGFDQLAKSVTGFGTIVNDGASDAALILAPNGSLPNFQGVIADGVKKTSLTILGDVALFGANTYSGATTVAAGALFLAGGSIAASSGLVIQTGGEFHDLAPGTAQITTLSNSGAVHLQGNGIALTKQASDVTGAFTGKSGVDDHLDITMDASLANFSLAAATFTIWSETKDFLSATGNALANVITGSSHGETIDGGGSNDTIDGGGGMDAARYAITRGAATIVRSSNGSVQILGGAEGLDTLTNVEWARFTDRKVWIGAQKSDFSNDGRSDLLWQNADGTAAFWSMNNGQFASGAALVNPGASWTLVGSGDFNGDRKADMLWQDAGGQVVEWLMNGSTLVTRAVIANPGAAWRAVGTGDFNADGFADIALQNVDGSVAVWDMNATTIAGAAVVANPGVDWKLAAAADFDADGSSDLLFQNTDGQVAIWRMDGTSLVSGSVLSANPGAVWHIRGAADFNQDGHADIVWQHDDGTVAVWSMFSAAAILTSATTGVVAAPGAAWKVGGVGDYTADRVADIALQNTVTGQAAIWTMNGTNLTPSGALLQQNPGVSWHMVV